MKAFYWEGERDTPSGKQLQIVVIFAKTQEEAIQFFYKKEGGEGNTIKEALDELLEFSEPLELSPGMGELALTMLAWHNNAQKMFYEKDSKHTPTLVNKLYRYTPGRLLYMLCKTEEMKEQKKPKEVKKVYLDDLE